MGEVKHLDAKVTTNLSQLFNNRVRITEDEGQASRSSKYSVCGLTSRCLVEFAQNMRQLLNSDVCVQGAWFVAVNHSPLKHCEAKHVPFYCTLQGS